MITRFCVDEEVHLGLFHTEIELSAQAVIHIMSFHAISSLTHNSITVLLKWCTDPFDAVEAGSHNDRTKHELTSLSVREYA